MSRKKSTIDELFSERLKILIEDKLKVSQIYFANKIGISQSYLSAVLKNIRGSSAELIAGLYIHYREYLDWLLTGEGEMIRGDKKGSLYNKVGIPVIHIAAPGAEYNADMDDFGRAATGLKEIFDSGDPVLIPAIQANIHAFQISVRREAHIQEQTKEISDLKKRMESLEKQMKEGDRRKGERRLQDLDPPNGLERRAGSERRKHAIGE